MVVQAKDKDETNRIAYKNISSNKIIHDEYDWIRILRK
jgi:hypothetical protein